MGVAYPRGPRRAPCTISPHQPHSTSKQSSYGRTDSYGTRLRCGTGMRKPLHCIRRARTSSRRVHPSGLPACISMSSSGVCTAGRPGSGRAIYPPFLPSSGDSESGPVSEANGRAAQSVSSDSPGHVPELPMGPSRGEMGAQLRSLCAPPKKSRILAAPELSQPHRVRVGTVAGPTVAPPPAWRTPARPRPEARSPSARRLAITGVADVFLIDEFQSAESSTNGNGTLPLSVAETIASAP